MEPVPTRCDVTIRRRASRGRALLLVLLLVSSAVVVSVVWAAVTIANFQVEAGETEINAFWETASEISNLGFYMWRSENRDSGYVKLPLDAPAEQFIPSEDFGVGSFYEFVDVQVTPGILYYYKVQDVPANGSAGEMVGPESAMIGPAITTPATSTATPTPTMTATPTSASGATATPMPDPSVRFWADKTSLDAGECTTIQWQTANVRTVFYNGTGVIGQGAQTVCPCELQTETLSVTYQDGTSEDFTVELTVSGTCRNPQPARTLSPSVLATPAPPPSPTPAPPTPIPATATPEASPAALTPTVRSRSTPEALLDPVESPAVEMSPLSTPDGAADLIGTPTAGPEDEFVGAVDDGSGPDGGLVVEGVAAPRRISPVVLVLVGLVGVGFLVGGVWLWRRG